MQSLWYITACGVGIAFGLYFGRLLTAIIMNWESTTAAVKWSMSVGCFVLGGGSGAVAFRVILSARHAAFYLLGLALAMIFAYFWPRIPRRLTLEIVAHIVNMSEALRNEVPDIEDRALLILTPFASPRHIAHKAKISKNEFVQKLEQAIDSFDQGGQSQDESVS